MKSRASIRPSLSVLKSPRMTAGLWSSFFSVRIVSEAKPGSERTPAAVGYVSLAGNVIRSCRGFRSSQAFAIAPSSTRFGCARSLKRAVSGTSGRRTEAPARMRGSRPISSVAKKSPSPATKITAVYPSGDRLPENLLRFYIHFSSPMSRGDAYRHLKLIDTATGKPVHAPFLELEEELWSPDGKRFTLLIDPGRIKRGLKPREMFGPVLESGKSYRLIIDRDWTDAEGNALAVRLSPDLSGRSARRDAARSQNWNLHPPQAGTRAPLEARFPEPLDRALLERLVSGSISPGRRCLVSVSIAEAETIWRFVPESPWQPGTYRLVIGTELEDVAGNSVASPFEVDMTAPITKRVESNQVVLPFQVGTRSQ